MSKENIYSNKDKQYNFAKALKEIGNSNQMHKLTGYEKDYQMQAELELKKLGVNPNNYLILPANTFNAGHKQFERVRNIEDLDNNALYKRLGVSIVDFEAGHSQKNSVPYNSEYNTQKVNIDRLHEDSDKQSPEPLNLERFDIDNCIVSGSITDTWDNLVSIAHSDLLLQDFDYAINRMIDEDLLTKAYSTNIVTGKTTAELRNEINLNTGLRSPAYVMNRTYYENTFITGVDETISFDQSRYKGYNAFSTDLLGVDKVIYGDWKRSTVALMSPIMIKLNPYSHSDEGKIKVSFMRYVDTNVSPYHFASI